MPCASQRKPQPTAEGALTTGGPFRAVLRWGKRAHGPVTGCRLLWEGGTPWGRGLSSADAIPKGAES